MARVLAPDVAKPRPPSDRSFAGPWTSLAALVLYGTLSLVFFFLPIAGAPRSTLIAPDTIDPSAFMWLFAWAPHAAVHGQNPLFSHAIFAPEGYNLAWSTPMVGPALLLGPLTSALGPVTTWNTLAVLAPALSAWTAFLLCRHVSGRMLPSLVGGYLFGFSAYMLGHLAAHPPIAMVPLLPAAALLVLKRLEGTLGSRAFVAALTAVLAGQFLISSETFVVATLFGAIALVIGWLTWPPRRIGLRRLTGLIAGAYLAAGVLLSPYLYTVVFEPHTEPDQALSTDPADLLSWLVPGHVQALSRGHARASVPHFATGLAYLGVPLLVLLLVAAWRWRDRAAVRFLGACAAVAAVATLGESLHVAGQNTHVPMPWVVFAHLPVLRYAIPLRLGVFVMLPAAVLVTLALSWSRGPALWVLAGAALVFLAPDVGNAYFKTPLRSPAFFQGDNSARFVGPRDTVLGVPTWGDTMRWQAERRFRFALAGGYLGAFPTDYVRYPTFRTVLSGRLGGRYAAQLRRFVRDKGVTVVVVDGRQRGPWRRLFGTLGVRPVRAEGVLVYRVRPRPVVRPRIP